MKKNNNSNNKNYDASSNSYGWIFILILAFLVSCAIIGGYALYEHATSPDNDYSFSEHTDLRDISDTNTATNLYNIITSNNVYYDMFYKESLTNKDYLAYGFTRLKIDIPSLFGEKFTVLRNRLDNTINNAFYNDSDLELYTPGSYDNYQFKCTYSSSASLYNCVSVLSDTSIVPILFSKLEKVEQESEFFYVYDKAVFVRVDDELSYFYTDINYKNSITLCDNTLSKADSVCTGFINDTDALNEYIFKQYSTSINTYKHTFIKQNGSYYFVSTEVVLDEALK